MFGITKENESTIKFNEEKLDTIVSSNITIDGKFKSTGNIRLDCTIIGILDSESLYLGQSADIKGDINCDNIIVAGKITGNVFCKGKMHIKETGIVNGDIEVSILSMDEGSTFSGKCTRKKFEPIKTDNLTNDDKKNKIDNKSNKKIN
ncbi:polymer-forming cytoskeletal protein [Sedimentibacter sp.]|nr:polymer-forming cytoskeletal protein [Sedimentibacter sp.]